MTVFWSKSGACWVPGCKMKKVNFDWHVWEGMSLRCWYIPRTTTALDRTQTLIRQFSQHPSISRGFACLRRSAAAL